MRVVLRITSTFGHGMAAALCAGISLNLEGQPSFAFSLIAAFHLVHGVRDAIRFALDR